MVNQLLVVIFAAASLAQQQGNSRDTRPTQQQGSEETLPASQLKAEHRGESCDCMEYWQCVTRGGEPISYCGLMETSVCCLQLEQPTDSSSKPKCGVKGFDSGQVGLAEPSEWPWHVAIVEEPGFYYVCGGALVDESWVLTAAHCVHPYLNQTTVQLKARLGEYDVTGTSESLAHDDRAVASVVLHPEFDETTLAADIALLRLQSPATQRPHIDVVCLPSQGRRVNIRSSCFLTGWGKITESGSYSPVLKEVPIPLWEDADCQTALQKEFGSSFQLNNNTLCAGATGRDACDGDGGGPLVCQEDGQWFQHGIVSFGFGCGHRGVPGVYTRVSAFHKWIQETVLMAPVISTTNVT